MFANRWQQSLFSGGIFCCWNPPPAHGGLFLSGTRGAGQTASCVLVSQQGQMNLRDPGIHDINNYVCETPLTRFIHTHLSQLG